MLIKRMLDSVSRPILNVLFAYDNRYRTRGKSERATEYAYVLKQLGKFEPDTVLDIGTGRSSLPHLLSYCGYKVTAIDLMRFYRNIPELNRHHPVKNHDITLKPMPASDAIIAISTIEHIKDIDLALKNIRLSMNLDGVFICTIPASTSGSDRLLSTDRYTVAYAEKSVSELVSDAGMKIIERELFTPKAGNCKKYGLDLFCFTAVIDKTSPITDTHTEHGKDFISYRKPRSWLR